MRYHPGQTRPRHLNALLIAGLLACIGSAHAAVQYEQIPATTTWNTITSLGGVPVTPFDLAPQNALSGGGSHTTIPGLPSPADGSLTVAPAGGKYNAGGPSNAQWANGFTGATFFNSSQTRTLTLPPRTTAFYAFAEPNDDGAFPVTATVDSGVTSGPVSVTTSGNTVADIPGFGFYTTTAGEAIQTITINVASGSYGFDIGLFGIAQAPAAPAPGTATAGTGQAELIFTAPAETGTEAITDYTATCTPQGGGTAVTATGTASPVTVPGLTAGTAYDCTVAATSAAGTGPASAALAVTPLATAASAPTPVPTLSHLALMLLSLGAAGLGARRLRKQA